MTTEPSPSRKRVPVQARAVATYEKLLDAAGELLAEVGIDNISTNRIVERAGLTPPAFYRYFNDKYDILSVLEARLLDAIKEQIAKHAGDHEPGETFKLRPAAVEAVLVETVDVVRNFSGGPWLIRALRAVPALTHLRLNSHQSTAHFLAEVAVAVNPETNRSEAYQGARLAIEIGYAAVEMVIDEPDLDVRAVMKDTARAISVLTDRETTRSTG